MFRPLLDFFRTGPDAPRRSEDPEEIRRLYERKRWSVFLSITFGYGMFYLCRVNFSVVKKPMLDQGILSATEMGVIGSIMLVVYAVGKLVNGFLADRSNIRRFMSIGLLIAAVANFLLGWTTLFVLFAVLWAINGWFQATGSAPSVVSISHWFSNRERGTRYGLWSIAHSIREGLTFAGTAYLVSKMGWRWGFWGPGLVCIAAAMILLRTLADRPQTYGLPPVADYKDDHAAIKTKSASSIGRMQIEVLKSPAVWILGLASASMYVARYGINNWGVLYLQEAKGYSLVSAGMVLAANTVAGLLGAISSGFVSDRVFGSRRNPPALIFGLMQVGALTAFFLIPPNNMVLDILAMCVFVFSLGGLLVYLGGLMAVDICPKKATGAAMGIVGLFSYTGAAVQDAVTGYLIDLGKTVVEGKTTYSFDAAFYFWIGASVLSILLAASIWKVKARD